MSQFSMQIDLPGGGRDPSLEGNEDVEQGLLSLAPKEDSRTEDTGSKPEEPNAASGRTDFGTCKVCLESKHNHWFCPYLTLVPKGKRVGSECDIICRICGFMFLNERCCGLDEGRAIFKECFECWKSGHWSEECP